MQRKKNKRIGSKPVTPDQAPDNTPVDTALTGLRKGELPPSCTSMPINFVGVVGIMLAIVGLRHAPSLSIEWQAAIILLSYALPIAVLEWTVLKTHRRASTGLDFHHRGPADVNRVLVKLIGLYATLGTLAGIYLLLPEYGGEFYHRYWAFLKQFAAVFVVGSAVYFYMIDRMMLKPQDGFWHAGMLVLGQFRQVDKATLAQHALGWLVKLFFLPLMFIYAANFIDKIVHFDFSPLFKFDFNDPSYAIFNDIFYGVDVIVVTVGYFLTLRVLDSHCRSTEPTAAGWFWALVCYEPIWTFVYGAYLNYNSDGYAWYNWLAGSPMLGAVWGGAIGLLTLIYVLASIAFGLRFSNLTNRGILTNGPYKYCKHPAYVSKNLSWWLISIPFIAHPNATFYSMVHDCILLLALNGIYFLRARTEERHLSSDPTYVAYATAMNERSIFAGLGRMIPLLQYTPGPKLVEIK